MNLDKNQLTKLFLEIDSVLSRSGHKNITTNNPLILEHSQEGGIVRVNLMDALRSAVNGQEIVTADEDRQSQPWYSDTDEFVNVAAMAVAQFNRN